MPAANDHHSVLVSPVIPGDRGFGMRMRAGLLYRALGLLGPVRVVVAPVFGPVDAEPGDVVGGDHLTVLDIDPAADPRIDFTRRLAEPSQRDRAATLHPRPALCRTATLEVVASVAGLVAGAARVLVMREYLAPLLDGVLDGADRPFCVLDVDDIESSARRQFGDPTEADRYEALEHHYFPLFDLVLACSDDDADELRDRYDITPVVVPNAVDVPTAMEPVPPRWDLLFVANLSYPPNVHAARWLCEEVLPRLDGATVALVGANPAPEVVTLGASDHALVTGTVPGVSPYYAASRIVCVPLHTGGGTSIKVLEAFAHRRPVVSTTTGGRGLPVRHGEHLLLADDADSFARACRGLLASPEQAGRLAAAGFNLVRERFTPQHVSALLADALSRQ